VLEAAGKGRPCCGVSATLAPRGRGIVHTSDHFRTAVPKGIVEADPRDSERPPARKEKTAGHPSAVITAAGRP
jgi:hypothetical protein